MKTRLTIFVAAMAGWLNRKQLDVINYLHAENEILKEQMEKKDVKLALSNIQRRKLAKCGKKLGRKGLMLTPDPFTYTISPVLMRLDGLFAISESRPLE